MPFLTAQLIIERDGAPFFSDAASCTLARPGDISGQDIVVRSYRTSSRPRWIYWGLARADYDNIDAKHREDAADAISPLADCYGSWRFNQRKSFCC
jgi:hypothetical protein